MQVIEPQVPKMLHAGHQPITVNGLHQDMTKMLYFENKKPRKVKSNLPV